MELTPAAWLWLGLALVCLMWLPATAGVAIDVGVVAGTHNGMCEEAMDGFGTVSTAADSDLELGRV